MISYINDTSIHQVFISIKVRYTLTNFGLSPCIEYIIFYFYIKIITLKIYAYDLTFLKMLINS